MNDVVINKVQSIQRCVLRAREEYRAAGGQFQSDYTRQDAAILNITRACEQAIDLANHLIRSEVEAVIKSGLDDLLAFAQVCLGRYGLGLQS